jgi:predicted dinucleotide-binding enzyme
LLLAQDLAVAKLPVLVFDPLVEAARVAHECKGVMVASSAEDCIARAGVVVLATPWQEFAEIPAATWT